MSKKLHKILQKYTKTLWFRKYWNPVFNVYNNNITKFLTKFWVVLFSYAYLHFQKKFINFDSAHY